MKMKRTTTGRILGGALLWSLASAAMAANYTNCVDGPFLDPNKGDYYAFVFWTSGANAYCYGTYQNSALEACKVAYAGERAYGIYLYGDVPVTVDPPTKIGQWDACSPMGNVTWLKASLPPAPPAPLPAAYPPEGCAAGANGFYKCLPSSGIDAIAPPPTTPRQNDGPPSRDGTDSRPSVDLSPILSESQGGSCLAADPPPPNAAGNPINSGTGNKYQREVDYSGSGTLSFERHYNSGLKTWVHNYMMRVRTDGTTAVVIRPNGKTLVFNGSGAGPWSANATVVEKLTRLSPVNGTDPAWKLVTADDSVEIYDGNGQPVAVTARGGRTVRMSYSSGALQSVTDDFGRSLNFSYDGQGRLANVTAPGGEAFNYSYGANGHLARVTYADGGTRQYLYENMGYPYALTGLVDQTGQRFATWSYDSQGRAVSSEHAGGVARHTLAFGADGLSVLVTDPLGAQRLLQHQDVAGRLVFAGSTLPCADCIGDAASTSVNGIGKVTQATDFVGVSHQYSYDEARQLPLSVTRAAGRPEAQSRVIEWHSTFRLPTLVTEAGRTTTYTYDSLGNKLSETIADLGTHQARTSAWTYNSQHLVDTMTDPKGGVWAYGYDGAGNRTSTRNPLGQQTIYSHDAAGRVTSQTAPNGLVTTYAYDARGRVVSQSRGGEVSLFGYWPTGQLVSASLPNGFQVSYTYDAAQRLVAAADNRGSSVQYTLDAMGNRVGEQVKDANGNIALATGRVINNLNQVVAIQGAQGQTTAFAYDANGEPVSISDPLQQTTRQTLDSLRRPTATTFADDTSAGQAWNQLDQLTQVTDPKGVATAYRANAFGEFVSESSPDIGVMSYQRDAGGGVVAVTDAKGATSTIARDALGRPTLITHADQTQSFSYDSAGNLIRVDDNSGSSIYTRDLLGRALTKTQSVNDSSSPSKYAVRYGYSAGELTSITYPSGLQIFLRRTAGRVTGIDAQPAPKGGKVQAVNALVSSIGYTALGAPQSWVWLSGDSSRRKFDADGRMIQSEIASYTYDAASRISSITQQLWVQGPKTQGGATTLYESAVTWNAGYDSRSRLTRFARGGAASTYNYDPNGNRLMSVDTTGSDVDLEGQFDSNNLTQSVNQAQNADAASNKLLGFSQTTTTLQGAATVSSVTSQVNYALDANGAMTSDGLRTFVYDASRRLAKAEVFNNGEGVGVVYLNNALGQRVFKSQPQVEQVTPNQKSLGKDFVKWLEANFGWLFTAGNGAKSMLGMAYVYDEQGNLLGEYDNGSAQGNGRTEYVWLPSDSGQALLIGLYKNASFYQVHADHLGTPRLITDSANAPVWQWPYSAFGNNKPTGPLSAITTGTQTRLKATAPAVEVNLRFPGQYFDSESNLSYNGFRSYNVGQGRYTQVDPIGWAGGPNGYLYVGANPLSYVDPLGLLKLPNDPGGLPPEWKPDPSHRDPTGQRFRHQSGDYLDFHPGRPGKPKYQGKDHWHHNGGDWHHLPGDEVPDPPCPEEPSLFERLLNSLSPKGNYDPRQDRWVPGPATPPFIPTLPGPGRFFIPMP